MLRLNESANPRTEANDDATEYETAYRGCNIMVVQRYIKEGPSFAHRGTTILGVQYGSVGKLSYRLQLALHRGESTDDLGRLLLSI